MAQQEMPNESGDVIESRKEERFETIEMLEAQFGGRAAVIRNLSIRGIGLRHREQVKLSSVVEVRIESPENETAMQLRCRVAWSRLSRVADERGRPFYESGLLILDDSTAAARLMERLIRAHGVLDPESLEAKRRMLEKRAKERPARPESSSSVPSTIPRVTHDHARRIHEALEILEGDPESAARWHERAKQSLVSIGLLASTADTAPHHRDVLVIWEYLGRTLDLDTVSTIAGFAIEA
ncbi:MAG: PilZ domain-containing protein [Thermoanaerobaculia bacterium]|jgi:hypothetical protein